jgi:hypothetical protein
MPFTNSIDLESHLQALKFSSPPKGLCISVAYANSLSNCVFCWITLQEKTSCMFMSCKWTVKSIFYSLYLHSKLSIYWMNNFSFLPNFYSWFSWVCALHISFCNGSLYQLFMLCFWYYICFNFFSSGVESDKCFYCSHIASAGVHIQLLYFLCHLVHQSSFQIFLQPLVLLVLFIFSLSDLLHNHGENFYSKYSHPLS